MRPSSNSNQKIAPVSAPGGDNSSRMGLGCATLFGSVFFLIGATTFFSLFLRPSWQILQAKNWPAAPCTITASTLNSRSGSDGTEYAADVLYSYNSNGQTYSSDHVSFGAQRWKSNLAGQQAIVSRYPVGAKFNCYVNPNDPNEAVLERQFSGDLWVGLIPLLFCGFGLGFPILMWRGSRSTSAKSAAWQPKRQIALDENSTEPLVLQPKSSRGASWLGLSFIALFWNGIVSVFVFQLFTGGLGFGNIFLGLFLIPFIGIGLVLIGAAISGFLSLFSARTQITLSRPLLRPGDSVEIGWKLGGGTMRPKAIKIWLEGREEATFRRGTDTITEKSPFFYRELFQSDSAAALDSGNTTLQLPSDTMHSFEAPNNKIVWTLTLHGAIKVWPDIKDEFVLAVEPREKGGAA